MLNFILRRLAIAIPTILVIIFFSFVLMHSAPGGPFTAERKLPPEVLANIEKKYGLDKPLYQQIGVYVKNVVIDFDFGPSFKYKNLTVNEIIASGFPVTLVYGLWSFLFATIIGVSLGVIAALKHNTWLDYLATSSAIIGSVLPNFVMAPLLV
ncbi:MAG: oligopeptide transporter permease, partial [Gammaproteobacteria bacterium]|nr:oligopeptide transporter permease [Gammaproteobacteria bacterium]